MFILNIFLATATFLAFDKAFGIMGHNLITFKPGYRNGRATELYLSDASVNLYSNFLFVLGVMLFLLLLLTNKIKVEGGQRDEDKGVQNFNAVVVSLFINSITPLFITIALFQEHVAGLFYVMIAVLIMVEIYFKRDSGITLMISLLLLYISDGSVYIFLLNAAVVFLMVGIASRLARSVYGEPYIGKESLASL